MFEDVLQYTIYYKITSETLHTFYFSVSHWRALPQIQCTQLKHCSNQGPRPSSMATTLAYGHLSVWSVGPLDHVIEEY